MGSARGRERGVAACGHAADPRVDGFGLDLDFGGGGPAGAMTADLNALAARLQAALLKYGRHLGGCAAFPATSEAQVEHDCDCGLVAALKEAKP